MNEHGNKSGWANYVVRLNNPGKWGTYVWAVTLYNCSVLVAQEKQGLQEEQQQHYFLLSPLWTEVQCGQIRLAGEQKVIPVHPYIQKATSSAAVNSYTLKP